YAAGARDALDHGGVLCRARGERSDDRDLAPAVLLGRGGQREHASAVHAAYTRIAPHGYGFIVPDANGWSRYLHFQTAWLLVLTGIVYLAVGLWNGHFRRNLLPEEGARSWRAYRERLAQYL